MFFEVSIIEVLLFCWGVLATAYALKYRHDAKGMGVFIRCILENKALRDDLVSELEQFKRRFRT